MSRDPLPATSFLSPTSRFPPDPHLSPSLVRMKLLPTLLVLVVVTSVVSCSEEKASDNRKLRYEQDKKEVASFLNTKSILRTVVKLLFGTSEESSATSRQVLNVLVKVRCLLPLACAS